MSLRSKMVLSFLLVALSSILLVAILVGRSTVTGFGDYVFQQERSDLQVAIEQSYVDGGGWEAVRRVVRGQPGAGRGMMGGGPHMAMPMGAFAVANTEGQVVIPGAGFRQGQLVGAEALEAGLPIQVDGQRVGTLMRAPQIADILPPAGQQFLATVNRILLISGAAAATLALIMGATLAGRLTRSLQKLKEGTWAVARGELGRQVDVRSGDEIGDLASSFNRMSADLARAEAARRHMTADIAHELRTPLSVILGNAEALADGVLPRSDENLQLIHEEAARLNRIVEDLRTLSLAEAGELSLAPRSVKPAELAESVVAGRRAAALEKGVDLVLDLHDEMPAVELDPDRFQQILGNLLDNALAHTMAGGRIWLRAGPSVDKLRFAVEDNGPGIASEDLPRLFDRFYRGDTSRSREKGGSGLGLAIAKSLVEAHGGKIRAEMREEGGARFVVETPYVAS